MKKTILLTFALAALLLASHAALAESSYGTAVIFGSPDRVPLLKDASTDAPSIGDYYVGTRVICDSDPSSPMVEVTIGQQHGFMSSAFLTQDALGVPSQQPIGVVHNTSDSWINVRQQPALSASVLTTATNGTRVTVLGETSTRWYCVEIDGELGYIRANLLSVTDEIPSQLVFASGTDNVPSPSLGVTAACQDVLSGTASFLNTEDNRQMLLSEVTSANGTDRYTLFAVVDLDADGTPEVILGGSRSYDSYEILREEDAAVVGYCVTYRAFLEPKTDGTFSFSSGAADSGYGTMSFSDGTATTVKRTYSESDFDQDNNFTISFFVEGKTSTEVSFNTAISAQSEKPDITWYPLTPQNIAALK